MFDVNGRPLRGSTPWQIECPTHNLVALTEEEYHQQMMRPTCTWFCPRCNARSMWDDTNYEIHMERARGED